ncbi:MAG TPA: nuclear transport factor 2 family protein [Ginsengibacter sp.]
MLRLITSLLLICTAASLNAQSTEKEKVVRAYYSGFERHTWNDVAAQFADGFTFTSPNNDDHISVDKFKEKCSGMAKYFKKVSYIKMLEKVNELMLLVQIITTDGKVIRNVDVYSFSSTGRSNPSKYFLGLAQNIRATRNNQRIEKESC